jgi:hypothetical protein
MVHGSPMIISKKEKDREIKRNIGKEESKKHK